MPDFYRAPEVILGMEWDEKIDIWCVGLMVRLSFHSWVYRMNTDTLSSGTCSKETASFLLSRTEFSMTSNI